MSTDKSTFAHKREIDTLWNVVRALIKAERASHEKIERRFEALRVKIYKDKKKGDKLWQEAEADQVPQDGAHPVQYPPEPQADRLTQNRQSLNLRYQQWQARRAGIPVKDGHIAVQEVEQCQEKEKV